MDKPKKVPVRFMAPFSMRCSKCQQFIYKSTKFNARKSSARETQLGARLFDLSFRCSHCSNEIVLRTDPQSAGYIILLGATKNLEASEAAAGVEVAPARAIRIRKPLPLPTQRRHVAMDDNDS